MHTLMYAGSDWGGYHFPKGLFKLPLDEGEKFLVVSAGIGTDVSFEECLLKSYPNVKVVSIDPTEVARHTVNLYRPQFEDRWMFVQEALTSDIFGRVVIGGAASSILATQGTLVPCTTLEAVLRGTFCDGCRFNCLKLDIEGSEYTVLDKGVFDCSRPDVIIVEFHHWLNGPGDAYPDDTIDNHYTIEDTMLAIEKLRARGYEWVHHELGSKERLIQTCLFVQKAIMKDVL